MLWDIRALMKPALSVIDMIPNVHRTPALALLRRAVLDGRPLGLRLPAEEKELAFHDAQVQLTSPIGARILRDLYQKGHIKLKKPARLPTPSLDAYIATEAEFRAAVTRILAEDQARRDRLAEVIADPALAQPAELTPWLVDRVLSAHLGHATPGSLQIAGLTCHRELREATGGTADGLRDEPQLLTWWTDAEGIRRGDAAA